MKRDRKTGPSGLTEHIGYWMRLVSNNVSHAFSRKLEGCGVTVAEWVIMREMYDSDGTTSASVIADLTGLSRGAVSKLITRLLEKGLVSRKESDSDRQYQDIELTPTAKEFVPKLAKIADQNDTEFFDCLSENEQARLRGLLKKLADHHHIKTVPTE